MRLGKINDLIFDQISAVLPWMFLIMALIVFVMLGFADADAPTNDVWHILTIGFLLFVVAIVLNVERDIKKQIKEIKKIREECTGRDI